VLVGDPTAEGDVKNVVATEVDTVPIQILAFPLFPIEHAPQKRNNLPTVAVAVAVDVDVDVEEDEEPEDVALAVSTLKTELK
jgi:hypothetical protein